MKNQSKFSNEEKAISVSTNRQLTKKHPTHGKGRETSDSRRDHYEHIARSSEDNASDENMESSPFVSDDSVERRIDIQEMVSIHPSNSPTPPDSLNEALLQLYAENALQASAPEIKTGFFNNSEAALFYKNYVEGFWLWPSVYTLLLAIDVIHYVIDENYGLTALDVFVGLPLSQTHAMKYFNGRTSTHNLLNNGFADLPTEGAAYGLLLGLVMLPPLALSTIKQIVRRLGEKNWLKPFGNTNAILHKLETEQPTWKQIAYWCAPLISYAEELEHAAFALRWNLLTDESDEILQAILLKAKNHTYLGRLQAMNALSYIASNRNQDKASAQRSTRAIKTLRDMMNNAGWHFPLKYYAEYLIQQSTQKSALYVVVKLYQLWAAQRLLFLLIQQIGGLVGYYFQTADCIKEGMTLQYFPEVADYLCTPCGNIDEIQLPFAAKKEIDTCLKTLLSEKHQPERLISLLTRFNHPTFVKQYNSIDFSKQDIAGWEEEWLQQLFAIFIRPTPYHSIHFTGQSEQINLLDKEKVSVILQFLSRINSGTLDFSHQHFSQEGRANLIDGLPTVRHEVIDLTDTDFTDANAMTLATLRANLSSHTIILDHNDMTDVGYQTLIGTYQASQARNSALYCGYNPFTSDVLLPVKANHLAIHSFAGVQLSTASLAHFGQTLANSSYRLLNLEETGLDERGVNIISPYLASTQLIAVNFKNNDLSDVEVTGFFGALPASLRYLNIAQTNLDNNGLYQVASFIYYARLLQSLHIESNSFDSEGWQALTEALIQSPLKNLYAADNNMNDEMGISFALQLNQTNLQTLDVSNNRLTSSGAIAIFNMAIRLNIRRLNLANNQIDTDFVEAFIQTIQKGGLISLDISGNTGLTETDIQRMLAAVQGSSLVEFAADTPISQSSACAILKSLIHASNDLTFLCDSYGHRDQTRILEKVTPRTNLQRLALNRNDQTVNAIIDRATEWVATEKDAINWSDDPTHYLFANDTDHTTKATDIRVNTQSMSFTLMGLGFFILWFMHYLKNQQTNHPLVKKLFSPSTQNTPDTQTQYASHTASVRR